MKSECYTLHRPASIRAAEVVLSLGEPVHVAPENHFETCVQRTVDPVLSGRIADNS